MKRSSILLALDAAGVKIQEVIQDAVRRDKALDTYEHVQEKGLLELENKKIQEIEKAQLKVETPEFGVGDTVKVHVKVVEGGKERIQIFEGIVLAKKHESNRETFIVRKISHGVGVERTY